MRGRWLEKEAADEAAAVQIEGCGGAGEYIRTPPL